MQMLSKSHEVKCLNSACNTTGTVFISNNVPVVLEDLKTIDVQQANDRVVLEGFILLEKHNKSHLPVCLKGKTLVQIMPGNKDSTKKILI